MRCPQCQGENSSEANFCSVCGFRFSKEGPRFAHTQTIRLRSTELTPGQLFALRYEVIEELGRGGMGRVYRVLDKKIEEEVGLKLIHPEISSDQMMIARFRNELKIARKITHKNVCRMYDLGQDEDTYYITMEYVPGEDLKSLVRKTGSLPADRTISIGKQIADGLAEAHDLGVVHRDLKSQNIMIDKARNVRIMDFGIACAAQSREVPETHLIIGTPDYMSPEQAEGGDADPRSDLYSLGIILYEMTTGHVPFEGDTALDLIRKQKTEIPRPPTDFNPQLRDDLNRLILKCLEKDRSRRFQEARHIYLELDSIEKDIRLSSAPGQRPALPSFFEDYDGGAEAEPPVLVARESELERLHAYLNTARAGSGQVVFITGEAGQGKTALSSSFAASANLAHDDLIVVSGKCNAQTGIGDPYLPFREVLSMLTGDIEAKWRAKAVSRDHAIRLWNFLPVSVRALLDNGPGLIDTFVEGRAIVARALSYSSGNEEWLTGLRKLVDIRESGRAVSSLQQSDFFEQYTRVLRLLAVRKPLLIILDDLQWADTGSVQLLFHLGRQLQGQRILIVGCYRPAEVALGRHQERHPLESVVQEFRRIFGSTAIDLGREEDRQFLEAIIDTESNKLGPAFRDFLFQQTKGHPLFTVELLRAMQDQGAIVRDSEGNWVEGTALDWKKLPVRMEAVIAERILRLPDSLREILAWASIEGEEFTAEVIAGVQGKDDLEVVRLLSNELDKRHQLVKAQGILEVNGRRLSKYRFHHILFQRYLYSTMDEVELAFRHEKVGRAIEILYGTEAKTLSIQLARHFKIARSPVKQIQYLEKAGEQALRHYAYREAIDFLSEVETLVKEALAEPSSFRRARRELWQGEACLGIGRLQESCDHLEGAISILDRAVPNKSWKMILGILRQVLRQVHHRLRPAHAVGRSKARATVLLTAARAYGYYAEMHYYMRKKFPAIYASLRALNLAESAGPSVELANNYGNMCVAAAVIPLHGLARIYARKAREVAQMVDPDSTLGYSMIISSIYSLGICQWETAEDMALQALRIFQRIGDWRRWEIAISCQARASFFQGDFRRSAREYSQLYEKALRRGDRQNQLLGLQGQAMTQLRRGHVQKVFQLLDAMDYETLSDEYAIEKLWACAILARTRLLQSQRELALKAAERAMSLFASSDPRIASAVAYMLATEVVLELYETSGLGNTPEQKTLMNMARLCCRNLARFARVFPVCQPSVNLWEGFYVWHEGKTGRARRLWQKSLRSAMKLKMPLDCGLAHYEIGRHASGAEFAEHLSAACKTFSELGASYQFARAEAALKSQAEARA
jgi:serine/threonine protein kinase/tetratricopeptide (TPR) repeat protein